jgi:hypothetical protein
MKKQAEEMTFRDLDGNIAIPEPIWPLERWYSELRDTRIADLEVPDLARACRQNLYPEAVVQLCLRKLEEDPLAGELYDGELVASLKRVTGDYWQGHPTERAQFLTLAARAYRETGDADVHVTEEDLLRSDA